MIIKTSHTLKRKKKAVKVEFKWNICQMQNVLKHQQTIICLTRQKTVAKCCEDCPQISADSNVNAWHTGTGVLIHSVCQSAPYALQLLTTSVQKLRRTFRALHELNGRISLSVGTRWPTRTKNRRYDINYNTNRCNVRNQVLIAVI